MNRVLFVDDEPSILSGLRRMLRPYRNDWDMSFSEGGEQALGLMDQDPFDVVVSDMRMPGMDGVELLSKVKQAHPDTIRIALSGHAEMEMLLESVQVTHQFLAKPSDAEHIRNVISQALALRQMLSNPNLRACISSIDMLPSLPSLYSQVTSIAASPDGTLKDIGKVISEDISMTAKILQIVNSAFFGLAREISSAEEATTILGLDVVRSLILSVKVFSLYDQRTCAIDLEQLNQHCQCVGILAKTIAKQEGLPAKACDFALMAGMLHDIGKLILATSFPDQYKEVYGNNQQTTDSQLEREAFGVSHAEIGAYLLGVWSLPNPVVEAVAYHHIPDKAVEHRFSSLTAVHVADALIYQKENNSIAELTAGLNMDYISRFADEDKLESWQQATAELFGEVN